MDNTERFDRLDAYIAENRVLRFCWSDLDADGRERACLLVALAPEVGAEGAVDRCPASVLPPWLAHLTPALDDGVSEAAWPEIVREYARVVRMGATTLDNAGWRRVKARFILAVLATAPSLEGETAAALWRRVLAGDEPHKEEWAAAAARASSAAWASAREEAWAAKAASASASASSAAWDRMARVLFDAIEAECAGATP